jgi:hypothetical protein
MVSGSRGSFCSEQLHLKDYADRPLSSDMRGRMRKRIRDGTAVGKTESAARWLFVLCGMQIIVLVQRCMQIPSF